MRSSQGSGPDVPLYSTSLSVFAMYVYATRIAMAEWLVNVVASYLPGVLSELRIQLPWGEMLAGWLAGWLE